ncbi:MAG TPA: CsbD family protein, partial [Candidatus Dormibacteraeota bacterium]|nr:CsbD family protein [Candidatus Dormibacteraeota bacterium]
CWLSPERTPSTSCSIASGWSPAGLKGASTRKLEVTGHLILRRTDVRRERLIAGRYLGRKDEIRGKAEEIKGKVTGDKSEEMKGKARQAADKTRRAVRDIRDDVRSEVDKAKEREHEPRSR